MRSNAWTTVPEFDFLNDLVPKFLSQQDIRVVGPWLAELTTAFFEKFPSRSAQFDRDRLTKKLRTWYGNHTRDCVKGTDARHVLDLSGKANRRPLPLQSSQAYSALYYREGAPIYHEIKNLYELYKSGDATTLASLRELFEQTPDDDPNTTALSSPPDPDVDPGKPPAPPKKKRQRKRRAGAATPQPDASTPQPDASTPQPDASTPQPDASTPQPDASTPQPDASTPQPDDPPPAPTKSTKKKRKSKKAASGADSAFYIPPFVHFQQTIIREKLKTISDDEAAAIERHIEDTYAYAMKVWEQPWLSHAKAGKITDKLEGEYYEKNANRLSHSLQVASEEVTRQSLFRTFFLWGGPSSVPGTLDILYTQTGGTIEGKKDFTSFLGPMYGELQEKFRQWLQLTYTKEELHRQPATGTSPRPLDIPQPLSGTPTPAPTDPVPSSTATPSSPIDFAATILDPSMMDLDRFDVDPHAVGLATTDPSVVTPTNVVGSTATNPGAINRAPSAITPPPPNLGIVIPANVLSPNAVNPSAINPTTSNPGVVSLATNPGVVDPTTPNPEAFSPVVVVHSATSPAVVNTTPATTTPDPRPLSPASGAEAMDTLPSFDPANSALVTACPKFITPQVVKHLFSITDVGGWLDLVKLYLEFEVASPSKNNTRLPSKGRPPEIDEWLTNQTDAHVSVSDMTVYIEAWTGWWGGCQPPGRATPSWPFSRESFPRAQWARFLNGGKNGIFLFVMALSWWAKSIDLGTNLPSLTEAVEDVKWVLRQLVDMLTTPQTPAPVSTTAQDSGLGKRKIVLTEKALRSGASVRKRYRR